MKDSKLKQRRRELVECAISCFCEQGIETTAIADIAVASGYGEATLYRYFSNKENLIMECGFTFWRMTSERYEALTESEAYQLESGIDQVEDLLLLTQDMFEIHRGMFKFLHDLDVYLASHQVNSEILAEYEELVNRAKPCLCEAIEKGKEDGTIKCRVSTEEIYYTLTHTVLSLLQKMAGIGQLLSGDHIVEEKRQIQLLRKLLLTGLQYEQT